VKINKWDYGLMTSLPDDFSVHIARLTDPTVNDSRNHLLVNGAFYWKGSSNEDYNLGFQWFQAPQIISR
jgi:hypothetical protein